MSRLCYLKCSVYVKEFGNVVLGTENGRQKFYSNYFQNTLFQKS